MAQIMIVIVMLVLLPEASKHDDQSDFAFVTDQQLAPEYLFVPMLHMAHIKKL